MRPLLPLTVLLMSGCLVTDEMVAAYVDRDRDGADALGADGGTDCDDADPDVGPHALEVCGDGVDNDCDGATDDVGVGARTWFPDADGDGHGDPDRPLTRCTRPDPSWRETAEDCDDGDARRHPGAHEDCLDGVDNDCDGDVDEVGSRRVLFPDADGDGHGDGAATAIEACEDRTGWSPLADDCDDTDGDVFPGAPDAAYDGIDADCGDDPWAELDADGDGHPLDPADPRVVDLGLAASGPFDCDDADADTWPGAPDPCDDGVDRDCAGDPEHDCDGDGFVSDQHGGSDCDDASADVNPDVPDDPPYDGIDADCDPTWDRDVDRDGTPWPTDCDDADPDRSTTCDTCADLDGDGAWSGCDAYTLRPFDCDDTDPAIGPHALDRLLDGRDEDCSGADLGTDPDEATHVSPSGDDTADCGPRDRPCATLAHAVGFGRPVLASGGLHGPIVTDVPIWGGLDPTSWHPGGPPSRIEGAAPVVTALGEHVALSGLEVTQDQTTSGVVVQIVGTTARLEQLIVHSAGSGTLVDVRADDVVVDGLDLSAENTGSVTGLSIVGDARLTDVRADDGGTGALTAVRVDGDLVASALDLSVTTPASGIALDVTGALDLSDSRLRAVGTALQGADALVARGPHLRIIRSELLSSGGRAALLSPEGPDVSILGSVLRSDTLDFGGVVLEVRDTPGLEVDIALSLIEAEGSQTVGAMLPGDARIVASLLSADTAVQPAGTLSLTHSVFETACVVAGSSCLADDETSLAACAWAGCSAASGNRLDPLGLLRGPTGLAIDLGPASPGRDLAGALPADLQLPVDLLGRQRPVGAWDAGPWELP